MHGPIVGATRESCKKYEIAERESCKKYEIAERESCEKDGPFPTILGLKKKIRRRRVLHLSIVARVQGPKKVSARSVRLSSFLPHPRNCRPGVILVLSRSPFLSVVLGPAHGSVLGLKLPASEFFRRRTLGEIFRSSPCEEVVNFSAAPQPCDESQ